MKSRHYCSNISSSSSSPFQNLSLETPLLTLERLIVLTFISPIILEQSFIADRCLARLILVVANLAPLPSLRLNITITRIY